jgi:DNA ligase-1
MPGFPSFSLRLDRDDACLVGPDLWLDPHRPRDFAFLSHAHADHFAAHRRILCSAATRRLVEARYGAAAARAEFLSPGFGEIVTLAGGWTAELRPAGHIPGSAMLRVTRPDDGATLLHTGDFKTRPAAGAEPVAPCRADTLILETTFGLPKFRFPPTGDVLAAIVKWCREAIEEGEIPVLMAYSLGKAQELLLSIHGLAPELVFQVHESVAKLNEAVASLGYPLPECAVFSPKERDPAGSVVIVPPNAARSLAVRKLRTSARLAMVSGWGMEPGAKYRYQCDEVFPLSDHAGYDDLLAFVEAVGPSRVFTIHGYTTEFAADLRRRGYEAWPLTGETQMELGALFEPTGSLQTGSIQTGYGPGTDTVRSDGTMESPLPTSGFGRFTSVCREITAMTGRLSKRGVLSAYLSGLDEADLVLAVRFLSASPLPRDGERRSLSVGWALIRQALLDLTGLGLVRFRQLSTAQGDGARTTALVLQGHTAPRDLALSEVAESFAELARTAGQSGKIRLLRDLFSACHPEEAARITGILLGDLRLGLKEGLLEEAVAEAYGRDPAAVREAHLLLGDLGETARLARSGELDRAGATWFTPLRVMLASPAEDATEIVTRLGGAGPVWLEDKFDGIRAQLHCRGGVAALYSRDLRPLEAEFPELIEAACGFERNVILDGEIIARAEGKRLGFFDLQKRLGRRDVRLDQGDLFHGAAVPVRFVAFDLLAIDGVGWLDRPLSERRAVLETLRFPAGFECCEVVRVDSAGAIDEAFNAARRRENEGLIAKDPASRYSPGRRGKQWLKLKKAMPTLDAVVVRAQQGHGKRSHVLSDYTFALRDEADGSLKVIGKAYSGLTDAEIEELTAHFRERTVEKRRGLHEVVPDVVLEIAFDSIQPSKRHESGLALRFPRIHAIRRDKTAAEIDTLAYARRLAGLA